MEINGCSQGFLGYHLLTRWLRIHWRYWSHEWTNSGDAILNGNPHSDVIFAIYHCNITWFPVAKGRGFLMVFVFMNEFLNQMHRWPTWTRHKKQLNHCKEWCPQPISSFLQFHVVWINWEGISQPSNLSCFHHTCFGYVKAFATSHTKSYRYSV